MREYDTSRKSSMTRLLRPADGMGLPSSRYARLGQAPTGDLQKECCTTPSDAATVFAYSRNARNAAWALSPAGISKRTGSALVELLSLSCVFVRKDPNDASSRSIAGSRNHLVSEAEASAARLDGRPLPGPANRAECFANLTTLSGVVSKCSLVIGGQKSRELRITP